MTVSIVVVAKEPRPGRVKTRLCPPCDEDQAAALAAAALADTLAVAAAVPAVRHVLALDGAPGPWVPRPFEVVAQVPGGLADRLGGAVAAIRGPAVLIGMDTPQVTVELLAEAARRLTTPGCDAVLGPALDGGWWCIGLRRPDPEAFTGVPMSTIETGARQRARLHELGLRTEPLPALRDVDTFADAIEVAALIPGSRFALTLTSVRSALPAMEATA